MPVTDTWKKIATESAFKGYASPLVTSYAGLGSTSFSIDGSDGAVGEVVGAGYQRIPIQWTDFVSDMSNSSVIIWLASGAWGNVRYVFVSDSSQGGSVLIYDSFTTKNVASGDLVTIDIGSLLIT